MSMVSTSHILRIHLGTSVSEFYHLLSTHCILTGQILPIKIFTCSDKSNNKSRRRPRKIILCKPLLIAQHQAL